MVFRCDIHDGETRGEDHAFFSDVRDLGYRVQLDPDVTLSHIGHKSYKASVWEAIKPAN